MYLLHDFWYYLQVRVYLHDLSMGRVMIYDLDRQKFCRKYIDVADKSQCIYNSKRKINITIVYYRRFFVFEFKTFSKSDFTQEYDMALYFEEFQHQPFC